MIVRVSALFLLFCVSGVSLAQSLDPSSFRDLSQTVQARRLLYDDPQLGSLNLGVRVTNRIAVLWGPVPSRELSLRAEERLRTMFELIEVRNQMTVVRSEETGLAGQEAPQFLPNPVPVTAPAPRAPFRPFAQPSTGVALAGIVTPDETITSRSSPVGPNGATELVTLRMPFLGSVMLHR